MPIKHILLFVVFSCLATGFLAGQDYHLSINGVSTKQSKIIDSIGYRKIDKDVNILRREVDSLIAKLEQVGYFSASMASFSKENDTLFKSTLELGAKTKSIILYYDTINADLIKSVSNQKIDNNSISIKPKNLKSLLSEINIRLADNGDPFSKVRLRNIETNEPGILKAELIIEQNTNRTIDKIVVKGYENFPKSYIKHFLKIKKGQNFNLKRINQNIKRLNSIAFASYKREPEVLFTNDSTLLYMYIEKKSANNFEGFLGFGTNETTGKLQFDGLVNLNLINNLNFGERLNIYYKSDETDQRTFNGNIEAPFIFGLPIGLNARLNIFKRDSTFLTSKQEASIQYQFSANGKINAGVETANSDNLLDNPVSNLQDFSTRLLKAEFETLSVDLSNRLFPMRHIFRFSASNGTRESNNTETSQTFLELEASKIFNFNLKNSIYGRLTGGYLISDNYLINEQYRFGGINSLRGFKENSINADLFTVLNTEYRYTVSPTLYVHSIIDLGYYEDSINQIEQNLLGFGFGFGILTEAGLLKLNYAGQKIEGQNVQLSDFKIHLKLVSRF